MFLGLACQFELNFGLLISKKCNLCEVAKVMFQVVEWQFDLIFVPLDETKMRL